MLYQLISIAGAIMILVAYAANQRGRMDRTDRSYNILNFVGSAFLALVAIDDGRIGFIVLESLWALLSVPGMLRAKSS